MRMAASRLLCLTNALIWVRNTCAARRTKARRTSSMTVFLVSFCNILFNFAIGLLVAKFLGPEEYGRFALAYATAIFVQTGFFDWIRLWRDAIYSNGSVTKEPALRATLISALPSSPPDLQWHLPASVHRHKVSLSYGLIALALRRRRRQRAFRLSYGAVRACF